MVVSISNFFLTDGLNKITHKLDLRSFLDTVLSNEGKEGLGS